MQRSVTEADHRSGPPCPATPPRPSAAILVPVVELRRFVALVFAGLGLPSDDAEIQARALIEAHLRGFETHGVNCIPDYALCLSQGRINPRPRIRIERRLPWAAVIDGDNGMGHVVATRAMEAALESAGALGIGAAAVRHGNHFGAASVYAAMAIEHDCIGFATANAAPTVAPWGSHTGLVGTNPVAVAVPAGRRPPFVMDLATSAAARRKFRQAAEEGRSLPEGWALDAEGNPTTDPRAAIDGIALPFGGAKGSALALLVDILAGVLTGAEFAGGVLSFHKNQRRHAHVGAFVMAVKVATFMPVARFKARMDTLAERVNALPPAPGFDRVRVPGERGARLAAEMGAHGIPLAPALVATLAALGAELGVPFPAP